MKNKLSGIVFTLALIAPTTAWADLRFGVAAEPYPPFTSKDSTGNWVGWEVDFMKALCLKLDEKCSIVEVAWEGIIPSLNTKKFDAVLASMSITEKRRAVIEFSDVYYKSSVKMIARVGAPDYHSPADLAGKSVGVQAASIQQDYAKKYFLPAGATIKTYATQDEIQADLAAGRIDYAMGEALELDAFLNSPQGACCHLAGGVKFDPTIFGVGVGLGLRKEDMELKQRLDGGIKSIVADGELAKITETWHLTGKIILPAEQ